MGILPRLRQQRLWLAFASLAFCLPWLATVGSGRCLLRAELPAASVVAPSQPASDCCPDCCPPITGVQAPAPQPAGPAFCCETFRICLPVEFGVAKFKRLESRGSSPADSPFLKLFAVIFNEARSSDAHATPDLSRPVPPGAFLRTVSRRCFPSHAPPSRPLS